MYLPWLRRRGAAQPITAPALPLPVPTATQAPPGEAREATRGQHQHYRLHEIQDAIRPGAKSLWQPLWLQKHEFLLGEK